MKSKSKSKSKEKNKKTDEKKPNKKSDKKVEKKSDKKTDKKAETDKENSPRKSINTNTKPQSLDKFPKNVNEFRHIMDDVNCCRADIEFMLELRRHKTIKSIEKNITGAEPHFYQDDLTKYKKKIEKKHDEKKLLETNIGTFRQILGDRAKYAINDATYRYEVCLRTEPNQVSRSVGKDGKTIINRRTTPWDSTTIPKEKSLFDTLLPPVLRPSREVFAKFENKVGRPVIQIKKEGFINGEKVKSRIFEYNNALASRFPSDHIPSSRYINDYGIPNVGSIKHLLNDDNRTMTSYWSTYLRGEKKKKFLPEETKQRERRLKDKSSGKYITKS